MSEPFIAIRSRDNPLVRQLRQLAQDGTGYRRQGRVWLEGEHLIGAAQARGWQPEMAVFSESFWASRQISQVRAATKNVVMPDALFATVSALESPAGCAWVLPLPEPSALLPHADSVVLDRLQDAGNVGSILRSAAAFGFHQVIALKGTVALWSPKVLRAGMGAHFALRLIEAAAADALDTLAVSMLQTSSHRGQWLHRAALPAPCAWLFGHEGQGIDAALATRLAARAAPSVSIRIAQPGGEESLNVAAAAAICLHASAAGRSAKGGSG